MGDCEHPESDRRYALESWTFFCRRCNSVVEYEPTDEQRVTRERRNYVLRPHTPK